MKKFILKFLVGGTAIMVGIFLIISFCIPNQFGSSYQSGMVLQYDSFKKMKGNKTVVIGNSSLLFGFDLDYFEQISNTKGQILGNHGGIGLPFFLELSKSNLTQGDTVIIEFLDVDPAIVSSDLLLSGIEGEVGLNQFIPRKQWKPVIEGYPTYATKKLKYWLFEPYKTAGTYSIDTYDNRGNMKLNRKSCTIPEPLDKNIYGLRTWTQNTNQGIIDYINAYTDYCETIGVDVYVTIYPVLDEAVRSSVEEIQASDENLRSRLKAPLISNSIDYIYSRELMYDAIAHCNSLGAKKRTEQLYKDLVTYQENHNSAN